ncbi:MAG: succinate dehydrogenase [Pseudomonadota bacterium]
MLFALQRLSALVMIPLVIGHVIVILYAVRGGLTADEILARTQGSVGWALFYGTFVLAAALHAPIGVRAILREWTPMPGRSVDVLMIGFGLVLLFLGLRAVYAVTGGPA